MRLAGSLDAAVLRLNPVLLLPVVFLNSIQGNATVFHGPLPVTLLVMDHWFEWETENREAGIYKVPM